VVAQLALVFAEEWFHATENFISLKSSCEPPEMQSSILNSKYEIHKAKCYAIDSGPDKDSNDTLDALFMAINSAKERIYITTPYFIPGSAIETSLKAAARRGVNVILLVPNKSDVPLIGYASRTYFPRLLSKGIRIFQYNSGFIHRKAIIVDDILSILGSANVDLRSFKLNFELSILIHSRSVNNALNEVYQKSLQSSIEIKSQDLSGRKKMALLIDSVAHLMSPLL
jgi:cardiolipin synthase